MDKRKLIYLIFLYVIIFNGWQLSFYPQMNSELSLFILLGYMCLGGFIWIDYRKKNYVHTNSIPLYFIMLGIFLSAFSALLVYSQSIIQSVITYRTQLYWLLLPLLLYIKPTSKEIMTSLVICTIMMWGIYILKSYAPTYFSYNQTTLIMKQGTDDIGYVEGLQLTTIPLYYYLDKLRFTINRRILFIVIICYSFIFVMQNRSFLFVSTLFLIYTFVVKIKIKHKLLFFTIFMFLGFLVYLQTMELWQALFEETKEQINNDDYNRNKSFMYFFTMANPHWLTYITGNGLLSSHTTSLVQDLMDMGIYNSDMGFIGYWNQYGIIPILVFLWLCIRTLKNRKAPYYVQLIACQILLCSMTTSYFGVLGHALFFILFYYLCIYYMPLHKKKILVKNDYNNYHKLP